MITHEASLFFTMPAIAWGNMIGVCRNDPKFLDRYAWANSVDPDQTAPIGAV